MKTRNTLKTAALLAGALGLSACASDQKTGDTAAADPNSYEALNERVQKAEFAAIEAQRQAAEAQRAAEEAQARADAAAAAAQSNEARTTRAFERSQFK